MSGVGRGSILRRMMDSALISDEHMNPPLQPFQTTGFLGSIGRGTSLMTPSQFMKSTSSVSAKNVTSTHKDDSKANVVTPTLKEDLSCEESNKKMIELSLHESDDKSAILDKENIPITKDNSSHQIHGDVNENRNVATSNTEHVTNLDTKIDVPNLNAKQNVHDNESTTADENISKQGWVMNKDVGADCVPVLASTSNAISETFFSIPEQKAKHTLPGEQRIPLQSKPKDFSPAIVSKERTEERSEDEKWKLYQVERKVKKMIKNITLENLGDMFQELECLIEERPLSSCYINCSEVQLLLEVLMKNAVQNSEFLPLAPCLIKMVSEHQPIEFKQYFPEICDAKCQEYVTLSASDDYLNKNGQDFCKLLGHLFAMPRQTGPTLFNIISTVVGEYVEQWTCPEGSEIAGHGLQEYRLAVDATAVRCLLLEITNKMLSCDREVETEMEKFVWFMRESVLNAKVPKKVREIYLDGLIEIQTTSGDGSVISASAYGLILGTNSQSESEADISFETDTGNGDEQVKIDDYCCTDMGEIKSVEVKSETDNSVTTTKEENDQFDFVTMENPPIDTIAMAPRIGNAYDSSTMVPKSSKAYGGGFGKMAMTFGNQPILRNKSRNTEDSDADVIIEDGGNDGSDMISDENRDDGNNVENVDNDDEKSFVAATNDKFIPNGNINRSHNNHPLVSSPLAKKKLPLGRGRGLARLPDFSDSGYSAKPVANVNPIGYSSCASTNKSHDLPIRSDRMFRAGVGESKPDNFQYPREEGSSIDRGTDNLHHHRGVGSNNDTKTYNSHHEFGGVSNNDSRTDNFHHQRVGDFNNDIRAEPFHRRRGGGSNNERRTDNFQNHRGNRGNYPFKNALNSSQSNMSCRERHQRFKNDTSNQKPRKTNFRPIYHKKNTSTRDDQRKASNPEDLVMGQPKKEMEKIYHPNGRLEYKIKPTQKQAFGSVIPQTCLRCNSSSHLAEDCPVTNIFF